MKIKFGVNLILLFLLPVLTITNSACSWYKYGDVSVDVRRNWEEYLMRARNGTGLISHTEGLYYKWVLEDLTEFLSNNKRRIYGEDQIQWLYDQAMIKLMAADFIESFKLFKEYMDLSGDDIRPWLHVGLQIGYYSISLKMYYILNAIDNAALHKEYIFNMNEVEFILNYTSAHFLAVIPESIIDSKAKGTEIYKTISEQYKYRQSRIGKEPVGVLIEELYYLDFHESYIDALATANPVAEEIDLIYRNYLGRRLYRKAYDVARKYGYGKTHFIGIYEFPIFLQSILEVLYQLGKYEEIISVYEQFPDNQHLLTLERTYCSGYFWVACAYARMGEYDSALEFLKLAFANTHLYNHLPFEPPQPPDGMTMNTLSLLWHIIISDAFEGFRAAGRYGEIDSLMEQELAKYSHLDWFR